MSRINLRGVDLNLLTVFEAVYEERSQSKAGERLGMSQPAISHALGRLRYQVNDPLFQGRTKGLVPTSKADDLYDQIHHALDVIRGEFSGKFRFDPKTAQRTFNVSLTYGGGHSFVPALYQRIQEQAPNARLVVRMIDPPNEIPELLREQRLDLALHPARFDDASLEQVIYAEDSLVLIARPEHPRIQSKPDLESLLREQFVMVYDLLTKFDDSSVSNLFESARQRTALEVPHALLLPHVVTLTDLVSIVVKSMAESFVAAFNLRHYPLPLTLPKNRSYMIWHQVMAQDPGHLWLREQLMALGKEMGIMNDLSA
jgi:DNA-binding transcriptional LysR family regulator